MKVNRKFGLTTITKNHGLIRLNTRALMDQQDPWQGSKSMGIGFTDRPLMMMWMVCQVAA